MAGEQAPRIQRVTDEHGDSWRVGTAADVAWIAGGTSTGMTITSAIPPVFDAYATVVLADGIGEVHAQFTRIMVELLEAQGSGPRWWLGYLCTGPDNLVCPGVRMSALPTVTLYAGWDYVLVEAGPRQAATWRRSGDTDQFWWHDVLPDLIFPADRSWLVSKLWDDDWACAGGPATLIGSLLAHPGLEARRVDLGEDATPPGHQAF
jgi:hypothetical protein